MSEDSEWLCLKVGHKATVKLARRVVVTSKLELKGRSNSKLTYLVDGTSSSSLLLAGEIASLTRGSWQHEKALKTL
jgi:hypothetical protein